MATQAASRHWTSLTDLSKSGSAPSIPSGSTTISSIQSVRYMTPCLDRLWMISC